MKSHHDLDLLEYVITLASDLGLSERDLLTVRNRTNHEGVSFLTKTLPLLAKALEKGLRDRFFKLPSNFHKVTRSSELPAFCGSLFRRIFRWSGDLRDDFCPYSVYVIRQLCYSVNKVDLPYTDEQESLVVDNFVRNEEIVQYINERGYLLSSSFNGVLSIARYIAADLFSDFDPSSLTTRNGPGVVSNSDYYQKNDKKLEPGLPVYRKFARTFFFNEEDAMTRLERYPTWTHCDYFRSAVTAKVVLVPKDSRGPRLISCEPQENQWAQQGIMDYMVRTLEGHPLTRGQVNFTDQSVNQRMAHVGSKDGSWATLDLKDASDRVSLRLVHDVFGSSAIYSSLLETRTPTTQLPDGRILKLNKFAPMGSALCFPVMATCIFLLLYSGLISEGTQPDIARRMVFVYGDDIIVPSAYAPKAIEILESFGLKVNADKSFINSVFAESCGKDYVAGNDVTPIRLRKCLNVSEAESTLSLMATAHQLSMAGLAKTAERLYATLESFLGSLPWGSLRSPYICRLITTGAGLIPEANAYRKGVKWTSSDDRIFDYQEPLGVRLKAWTWKSREIEKSESGYAHMLRTWSSLGNEDFLKIPTLGRFDRPRSVYLARGSFNHYSME